MMLEHCQPCPSLYSKWWHDKILHTNKTLRMKVKAAI